jgi:hypothetical protein
VRAAATPGSSPRPRGALLLVCAVLVAAGLASRSAFAARLPGWIVAHAGDALWAANLYFAFALLRPAARPGALLLVCLLTASAVEVSQLFHPAWLDAARATRLGALVLGRGFLAVDLLRYAAGAVLATGLDRACFGRRGG